jgi:hypothetical protein
MSQNFQGFDPSPEDDDFWEGVDLVPENASPTQRLLHRLDNTDLVSFTLEKSLEEKYSKSLTRSIRKLFNDIDEGQEIGEEHPTFELINGCFVSESPADVRQVFGAVLAIINRTIDERAEACGQNEADISSVKLVYENLLRSGCDRLIDATFPSIFLVLKKEVDELIGGFRRKINLAKHQIKVFSSYQAPDSNGTDLDSFVVGRYLEISEEAERISRFEFGELYIAMQNEYSNFVDRAIDDLFDLAPELMQLPVENDPDDFDYHSRLQSECVEAYRKTFNDELELFFKKNRATLKADKKKLYNSLSQSAKSALSSPS